LDNNIRKISLNDDFSSLKNIIPISFYFNNQWYSLTKTTKLSDLLINLSQKLYIMDSTKFKRLPKETATESNGTLHFKIAFDDRVLKEPFKLENSSLFIDLGLSPLELQSLLKQILVIYKLDKTPFFIRIKDMPPTKSVRDELYTNSNKTKHIHNKDKITDNWYGSSYHYAYLSKKENKTIRLRVVNDPSLIGGIKVEINNRVFDGSIKNKVALLKKELLRK
jgi:hypothetical protein